MIQLVATVPLPTIECGVEGCPGYFVAGDGAVLLVVNRTQILLVCAGCRKRVFAPAVVQVAEVNDGASRTALFPLGNSYDA